MFWYVNVNSHCSVKDTINIIAQGRHVFVYSRSPRVAGRHTTLITRKVETPCHPDRTGPPCTIICLMIIKFDF